MRFVLRPLLLYVLALAFFDRIFVFVHITNEGALLTAALILFVLKVILKPFLNILMLPINIVTLGLFSWLTHVLIVFGTTLLVPGFKLTPASFSAFQVGSLLFPALNFNLLWTYILFSFFLSWLVHFLDWLFTKGE